MNCSKTIPQHCGWEMVCQDGICMDLSNPLENGAVCVHHAQCGSDNCGPQDSPSSPRRCAPPDGASNTSCVGPFDCPQGLWCAPDGLCSPPLLPLSDCTPQLDYPQPNFVCPPGFGCLQTGSTGKCTPYYTGEEGAVCDPTDAWWSCQYGLICGENQDTTTNTNQPFKCTSQPLNPLSTRCAASPFSEADMQVCPLGATCGCYGSESNRSKSHCNVVVNTNCQLQIADLAACLAKKQCPHDAVQMLGGNPTPFAGSVLMGSCQQERCGTHHAALLRCQNAALKTGKSPAYVPRVGPNYYKPPPSQFESWQIACVIIAGSDFALIFLILSISYLRRNVM